MIDHGTLDLTYAAAASFTGKQYKFVKLTGDRTVNIAGAGEQVEGVLQNTPEAAGYAAHVRGDGTTQIVLGGTVAAGAPLKSDANGDAVTAVSTNKYYLIAMEAGVDNDIIEARFETGTV